jgi:hypothetical protein
VKGFENDEFCHFEEKGWKGQKRKYHKGFLAVTSRIFGVFLLLEACVPETVVFQSISIKSYLKIYLKVPS